MDMPALKTDSEFRTLIRPLTRQEYLQLEENILSDGCLTPIAVWNGVIVDGHNRYEICRKHGIPFRTEEKHFECREEAIAWICAVQLGRRNLSDETRKFLIGLQYENEKIVNERKNLQGLNQYSPDAPLPEDSFPSRNRTAHKIAEEYHISRSTVEKYAAYTRALEAIGKKEPNLVPKILSGKYKVSHKGITELADLPASEVQSINRRLEIGSPAFVRYQASRREISQARNSVPGASVKDMPQYDPDAEVTGLCLTIPSWTGSILRAEQNTDFSAVSPDAKNKLKAELMDLQNSAAHLLNILREESNA